MSRIRSLFSVLLFLALPVFVLPVQGEDRDDDSRFETKYGKNFPLPANGRVTIHHGFGDLTLRSHNGSDVQVRATIRSSDEELGKQIRIVAGPEGNGVSITTHYPEMRRSFRGQLSYSVDMTVTVPAGASVSAETEFGNIDARGLQTASLRNKQGAIRAADTRGSLTVANSFGAVEAINTGGDLTVQNANGSITVRKLEGALTAANRFGSVTVTDARRAVTITNANGAIEAMDIGGTLKAVNAFGNVKASTIAGTTDITTSNAQVELSNVQGAATVRNSFGSVEATNINGPLTVDGSNSRLEASAIKGNVTVENGFGPVKLRGVTGHAKIQNANGDVVVEDLSGSLNVESRFGAVIADRVRGTVDVNNSNGNVKLTDVGAAKVRASFGSVFAERVTGAVDVVNSNGAISVTGLRGTGCHPLSLRTNFSTIKVELPEGIGYNVNARTSFGRINTALPITTSNISDDTVVGTIGKGGCKLDLVNSNGNITIDKGK